MSGFLRERIKRREAKIRELERHIHDLNLMLVNACSDMEGLQTSKRDEMTERGERLMSFVHKVSQSRSKFAKEAQALL